MTREELNQKMAHGFVDLLKNYYNLTPAAQALIRHRIINVIQSQELTDCGKLLINPEIKKQSPV